MEGKGLCAIFQYGRTLKGTCHFQKNDQFMHLKWRKIQFKKKLKVFGTVLNTYQAVTWPLPPVSLLIWISPSRTLVLPHPRNLRCLQCCWPNLTPLPESIALLRMWQPAATSKEPLKALNMHNRPEQCTQRTQSNTNYTLNKSKKATHGCRGEPRHSDTKKKLSKTWTDSFCEFLMRGSSTSAAGLCQVRLPQSHQRSSRVSRQSSSTAPRWMDLWLCLCSYWRVSEGFWWLSVRKGLHSSFPDIRSGETPQ